MLTQTRDTAPRPKRKRCKIHSPPDPNCDRCKKALDKNKYATKKTMSQGILDVALFTSSASQLKYVLQVGALHEFYYVMLTLLSLSMILQVSSALVSLYLGSALDLNKEDDEKSANNVNNSVLAINIVVVALNILITSFDMRHSDEVGFHALNGTYFVNNNGTVFCNCTELCL